MKKTHLPIEEVIYRLQKIIPPGSLVYGVPRGGLMAAAFVKDLAGGIVPTPEEADIILDDIIDSGRTRDKYLGLYPDKPFVAVVDKQSSKADYEMGWVVFPWEKEDVEEDHENHVVRLLELIGDDPTREGLSGTPERVLRSFKTLYGGYGKNPADVCTTFEEGACDEMVILRDIEFYSTCEHHMLPFFGKAHIAYIPNGKVIGVSKLARILEIYARRLQIQERIGQQVTSAVEKLLTPKGVACVLEAQHFCMTSRGVQKQNSVMVTSSLTGVFQEEHDTRAEFLSLIH